MGYLVAMDGPAREPSVPSIVESIEGRSTLETERLVAMLRSWCWPGGSDRREPGQALGPGADHRAAGGVLVRAGSLRGM